MAAPKRGLVGVVGLGIMGGAFAENLLAAGWRVVGYDIAGARRRALARAGVEIAADTGDLPALVLLAPYLSMPLRDSVAAWLAPLWRWWIPVARTASAGSILDPIERARNLAYGVFVPSALSGLRTTQRRGQAALCSAAR